MTKRKREVIAHPTDDESEPTSIQDSAVRKEKDKKSTLIDDANALSATSFSERYIEQNSLLSHGDVDRGFTKISLHYANRIKSADLDACYHLIDATSRKDYESSSQGWSEKRKRREMMDPDMRYLIAFGGASKGPRFQGFLSFMLTHDSSPSVPVLYIYEIHITEDARGKGLGLHFMNMVEKIARRVGVDKVMLTCFLTNKNAHSFYKHFGYQRDVCSPEDRRIRNKVVKFDYVILSKDLRD